MKNTRKILVALIVVIAILMSMAALTMTASAANIPAGTVLYLVPSANWNESNARFAAYFFGNGEAWVSMTKVPGQSNLYECTVPSPGNWTNVIFCRMNPNAADNNWNNKWNQTSDLVYNGTSNCYTVAEGTWDKGGGTWSTYGSSCVHANIGPAATCTEAQVCLDCGDPVVSALGHSYNADHLCTRCNGQASFTVAGTGAHLGTEWDTGNTANDMTYADGVYTIVYTNVTAGSYKFKVVRDHDWGTAYPDADKVYTVSATGNTVIITLKGTVVEVKEETPHVHEFVEGKCECGETDPNYVPPHVHSWSDATCTEAQKCECGETQGEALGHSFAEGACSVCGAEDPNYVPPHEHNFVEGKCECGESDPNYVPPHEHNFVEGKCECGETDPDYVAPVANDKLINFSTWPEFAKETYADGDVVKHNDIFTFIYGKNSRVDPSSKDWDDFSGTLRFSLGGKTNAGVPTKNAIQITVDGAHTLKIWYVAGGDGRYFELRDADGVALSTTTAETVKNGQYYGELELPAAGVYYLTIPADNQYIFQLELVAKAVEPTPHEHNFVDGKCECGETDPNYVPPHVNTLVVGDTNKIVVSGETLNDYNLPVEWVLFTADENAFYSFVGDNGALAFIFTADGALVSSTGAANLEAGTYLVCLGNGFAGEFNVAVTKSAWVNALALGDNKILITDALDNGHGYFIVWVSFEVTEKANYTFTGEGILALVYDSAYQAVSGTELDAGTYNVCIAFTTAATTGVANVKVEKTASGDEPVVEPELPELVLGDNTVVIDGSVTNLAGNAIAWLELVITEAGTYKVSSADLSCYIYSEMNLADLSACICGFSGTATLEPGTYYVCVGKEGIKGEFTVTLESLDAPVHKNAIVLGDNHYIVSEELFEDKAEWLAVYLEPGTYVINGCDPLVVYVFYANPDATLTGTEAFAWNVDNDYNILTSLEFTVATAGYYWVGINFDYIGEQREFDFTLYAKCEEPPVHEHNFVDGKCECGESDPNYVPPVEDEEPEEKPEEKPETEAPAEEAPELNFFQKIWQAILNFFKNLFGKKD